MLVLMLILLFSNRRVESAVVVGRWYDRIYIYEK